ncbi:MAG: SUMF1/EgtB/PvdO family nonheme iron enzyme [Microcystis sp. M114S2]|jgi:formylglycine-generating enzyme required for sulfatase activity/tRNA A-37 threonylcarbamoyl transferase component Bud32|uniref:bifunctional serine/threonine-protein kinase/formylglycine-generating enzyme family protein n=1 Tax=unclassified Microcystis TaxID=2643300 RepID=UPI0025854569|nr:MULTISPECIES: bifunctional serine/threonine-protein kinase/formylglycine-generating enzyme family protein [unclassified Microcystis]MCA2667173.1 SUMF1/EgtB/PvdO family nonheme iron enzyme [Microcystis sp. M045S2]MCA2713032.1 SUMF1/EgtB/PvdO family nonheme iron enzyme [Microcystis sp. M172S2]MCA2804682.1 SUMF1/EgtB/PvdO family nonheme iron enzyme [Microcystis sp. M114S2]MCA2835343.1 SUMF1/EgtB/PvdO family nonheme iron enzyme [Microcystis sp. M007S1]MCA2838894.1 SUMF1/EgtB/PvdO family nonheme
MSILYCLNPECSHPQNPTHYSYCQGCGGNLSQTSQSYSFHSRYLIVGVLGEGAFGRTYKAEDLNFNRKPRVIKKFIAQMQGAALEKSKELFQREAEKLDELRHEQIPSVYDYFSEGNSLYLVEGFIEGETLFQEYQREGKFSEQKIQEILRDLLPVLAYLHSKGLIHRDIKPDNLMRRRSDGKLMLIDFGGIKEQTSQMGTGLYTPGYAPYEHIMGSAVAASDLYSLAATCVRLLTGCFPQSNSNLPDSVYDVDQRRWLWQSVLKSQKRSISDFWANILNKMLEDKSSQRYQSASEVLTVLNNPPSSRTVVQPTTVSPPPQRKISTTSGITRRKWLYNSIGMIVFGAVIALVIDKRNAWLKLLPATSPSDFTEKLPGGLQLAMVELPGGKFMMGSPDSDPDARDNEKPQHQVQVNSFAIGKYPVTQAQYEAVMGTNPSYFKNNPQNPVEQVSWNDAQAFCKKLSQITGKTYRLPTEAEWEYACRAGTTTRFYFGDDANQLGDYAWYEGNSGGTTHPVGQKKPNAWGLYDISGNVWEWCEDNWHSTYENAPKDGSAWLTNDNDFKILRGGSWVVIPNGCRSASRRYYYRRDFYYYGGFRVVCGAGRTL